LDDEGNAMESLNSYLAESNVPEEYDFRFNMLPGNVDNSDGLSIVDAADSAFVLPLVGQLIADLSPGIFISTSYDANVEIIGDNLINGSDSSAAVSKVGAKLDWP
jgi:hypothetical protein